jgi:uncharacterized protein (DUF433 family)
MGERMAGYKYDWDVIIKTLESGVSRQDVCEMFGIRREYLVQMLGYFNLRHLQLRVSQPRRKPTPPPKPKFTCPIMQKIEVIKLLGNKLSPHEIAEKLSIRQKDVDVIIASVRGKKCVS